MLERLRSIFVGVSLLSCSCANGQKESIRINIRELDSVTFRVTVFNNSDSIVCFRTSGFLTPKNLTTDSSILLKPIRLDEKQNLYYSPTRVATADDIQVEGGFLNAIVLLPYLIKSFDFRVEPNDMSKILELSYFNLHEFDYRKFNEEIQEFGWHRRYKIKYLYKEF